ARRLAAQDPAAAAAFWRATGFAAEAAAPPARRAAFWRLRQALARTLWVAGDVADAYALADDRTQTAPGAIASSGFLAGFIALEGLHQPARAAAQFHRLAVSRAVITRARRHYWLARAAAAAGADPTGEYRAAARYPTTFYGQLAARALGLSPVALLRARKDPAFDQAAARAFTARPLVRAALLLAAWHQPGRARAFLVRVAALSPEPATETLAARLGLALDIPSAAVFIARQAGVEGTLLPVAGWPVAAVPADGAVAPAVVLSLIRQESSFDPGAVSPSGARGLMQLMPGTAEEMARDLGARVTLAALTADPARNVRLGEAYFARLLDRFGGSLPLAVAAYNAGPYRVTQWLTANGDPRGHPRWMTDWIERIPYPETRNYVQRVLEGVVDYLARTNSSAPVLIAQWLGPAPAGKPR
ncbi:MAG: lytic transglycosylase domain-containing protein, partial [Acetobacteraceae bacterium]